jgi:hypothetical protein
VNRLQSLQFLQRTKTPDTIETRQQQPRRLARAKAKAPPPPPSTSASTSASDPTLKHGSSSSSGNLAAAVTSCSSCSIAILDLGNAQDSKAYNEAVEWTKEKFDLPSDKFFGYRQRVLTHCSIHGLIPVIMVPHLAQGEPLAVALNFIENYSIIAMSECQVHGMAILAVLGKFIQYLTELTNTRGTCHHWLGTGSIYNQR